MLFSAKRGAGVGEQQQRVRGWGRGDAFSRADLGDVPVKGHLGEPFSADNNGRDGGRRGRSNSKGRGAVESLKRFSATAGA